MKKIFLLAAAALVLAGCDNNDDTPESTQEAIKITATIGESVSTRASNDSWEKNDMIGISSKVGDVAGPYFNVPYTTKEGDGNFTGQLLYYYKSMTLTAYYPYTDSGSDVENSLPGADGVIEANTRPANQKPEKQSGIDFLWDSQTGFTVENRNVDFKFAHKMSKVTFTFQNSTAVIDENGQEIAGPVFVNCMTNYTIGNLVLEGTFDTNTGECAVKTDAVTEALSIDVENVENDKSLESIIIFPQILKGGYATLYITTDEIKQEGNTQYQHYKCNLSFSDGEILAGYHYNYTIKVTKVGLIVGKMTVAPWREQNRYMTATIDGDNAFKETNNP